MRPVSAAWNGGLSRSNHLFLSLYWFSINFHWGALLSVLLPTEVLTRSPDVSKALYLGLIAGIGSLTGMLVQPLAGSISDRSRSAWGKRRPLILLGAVIDIAGLLIMAGAVSLFSLAGGFLLVQLGNNISSAAYQGYIPDLVPRNQRGAASGYMGLMSMLGTVVSFGVAALLIRPGNTVSFYFVLIAVIVVGVVITFWKVPDKPAGDHEVSARLPWAQTVRNRDFVWLTVTRGLVILSLYTMVTFIEYYLKDKTGVPDFVAATLLVAGLALAGSLLSALVAGHVSDRIGRKRIVSAATIAMGLAFLAFMFSPSWNMILVIGALFGLGYGAYTSVDWALALDVLPDRNSMARDLGIWGFAVSLPQTLAPLIGGAFIYFLQPAGQGYAMAFLLAALASLAAAVLVWRIRSVR